MSSAPTTSQQSIARDFDPVHALAVRFCQAAADVVRTLRETNPDIDESLTDPTNIDPVITATKRPELGDFQSNIAMPLGKRVGMNPRELAQRIVEALDVGDLAEPLSAESIAGPGFINMRLRTDALASLLGALDTPALGIETPTEQQTVVVDLFGVNLAKQMHVGHLRATVIGDTLARVFERLGHKVIRQNHAGDWGLPIAMVTARLKSEAEAGRLDPDTISLDDLDRLYRQAQQDCAGDRFGLAAARKWDMGPKIIAELEAQVGGAEESLAHAKSTLIKLQSGDADITAYWQKIYNVTMGEGLAVCKRLHTKITDEATAGESTYRNELADVVDDLVQKGVAEESDGALVVRLKDVGIEEPCLIRKSDGGFLYATTDIAAIRRRVQRLGADEVVYCIDARQSLHMRQVFAVSEKAGYTIKPGAPDGEHAILQHAAFGTVLGEDNRPFKSRSGENVNLAALLAEAVERAQATVASKSPDMPTDERATVAEAIGIAAIKYADLSSDRVRDYVFSFDRMLAFEGNTGPYLLYALVRIRSIFRKLAERGYDVSASAIHAAPFAVEHPKEKALALQILGYPASVRNVAKYAEPHRLCNHVYELASAFASFFDACSVLNAETDAQRQSRMRLCDLTARVLADALDTLGLPTVERM
ncbi:MAG: arginine--tRNA ligase [Phycisphaeraceae bacterium]|nr:arginine--tRNA ligase [Phycisphaerales bacterium]MCB9859467.1 arginine--tRNA ligase [Phycisphaeraceae bacterium]